MPHLAASLWGHSKFKTIQTLRPVTPFGGLVSFISFLRQAGYRQPGTLRTAVFFCGAILGKSGRQAVLHLSSSRGGLNKHKPLMNAVLNWSKSTSPKSDRAGPLVCDEDGFLQQKPVPI